ncbi:MAG: M48 family metalloprotease [Sphingorhabdus sp.]
MAPTKKFLLLGASTVLLTGCVASGASDAGATSAGTAPTPATAAGTAKAPKYANAKPISSKEKAQGAKLHPQILNEFGGEWQSGQTAYVVRVGKNIAVQSGLGNAAQDFNVSLLNSSVNNAFAIPGGYIYITRQLVALCNSEAEMAGVLGHEVGHVAARHSKKRQRRSTIANIGAVAGTILGAVLGGNSGLLGTLGQGLREYSGALAQVFTLSYSRSQEEESDDLGIAYLSSAGYDPSALSDMLASLAMQTSVDTRAAGRQEQAIPDWARTHPEPAKRVARAASNARAYAASNRRGRNTHLANINGMLYGDDPKQGVIEGNTFKHPDLRLKFSVPSGFGMANGARAVSINGSSGKAIFTTQAYSGNKAAYIQSAFKAVSGKNSQINYGEIRQTTINGIPAFYSTALVPGQNGSQTSVTVFAYEFSNSQAFHFVTLSSGNNSPFGNMYQTMSRLSQSEAKSIKPRKIRIVTVKRGDTAASLASKMAYNSLKTDRFLALNGMRSSDALRAGAKVKIVTY